MLNVASCRRGLVLAGSTLACLGSISSAADFGQWQVESKLGARADYDSNVFLNNTDISDTVATGSLSVDAVRDVALVNTNLSVGATALSFFQHSAQNSVDPYVRANFVYTPSDKTTLSTGARFQRDTLANEALNTRTKSNDLNLDASLQNLFSPKLGYRLNGAYRESDYLTPGYSDVLSYSLGADVVYVYSPKLTMLVGYNYRESWNDSQPATAGRNPAGRDSRFSVGFEGELAPKVSGTLNVGWVHRTFDANVFGDASTLFISSRLKWVPVQKTVVTIDASQDFDVTAASQLSKVSSLSVTATQVLNDKWSCDTSVGFSHAVYSGSITALNRRDDTYRLKGRLSYAWATNVSVELSLGYGNTDSTSIFSTYDRVNAGVGFTASF